MAHPFCPWSLYAKKPGTIPTTISRTPPEFIAMPNVSRDNEIYTAVRCLLEHLPHCLWGRWLVFEQLHTALKRSGFPGLPEKVLLIALKRARCHRDNYMQTRYYLFGDSDHIDKAPNCYKTQRDSQRLPGRSNRIHLSHFLQSTRRNGDLGKAVERLRLAVYDDGHTQERGNVKEARQVTKMTAQSDWTGSTKQKAFTQRGNNRSK